MSTLDRNEFTVYSWPRCLRDTIQECNYEIYFLRDIPREPRFRNHFPLPFLTLFPCWLYRYRNVTAVTEYERTEMDVSRINLQPGSRANCLLDRFSPFYSLCVIKCFDSRKPSYIISVCKLPCLKDQYYYLLCEANEFKVKFLLFCVKTKS